VLAAVTLHAGKRFPHRAPCAPTTSGGSNLNGAAGRKPAQGAHACRDHDSHSLTRCADPVPTHLPTHPSRTHPLHTPSPRGPRRLVHCPFALPSAANPHARTRTNALTPHTHAHACGDRVHPAKPHRAARAAQLAQRGARTDLCRHNRDRSGADGTESRSRLFGPVGAPPTLGGAAPFSRQGFVIDGM
jgi:hypothetical protein